VSPRSARRGRRGPQIWRRLQRCRLFGGSLTATGTPASLASPRVSQPPAPTAFSPRASAEIGRVPERGRGRRIEVAAVLLASVAIFAIYAWSGRFWLDLIDEGYFVYLGSRVHAGDLPYRDFDTYYTPGIFYLFAWTFDLFGVSVEPIRLLMSGVRVLWAVALYGLTRRVAPWPFALLPFAAIAAVDAAPLFPEPHPSWLAMLATFGVIEAITRHQGTNARRWIVVAGALAGVAFAFKQNVGAFDALAIGAYALLHERPLAGRLLLAAQWIIALALGAAVSALVWPGLSSPLAATVLLPLLATLALLVWLAWSHTEVDGWTGGLRPLVLDTVVSGAAFVAVTLAWLVPLTLALGVGGVPWGLFVGNVNQGALILPLDPPSPGTRPVLLAATLLPIAAALPRGRSGLPPQRMLAGALVVSGLLPLVPVGPRLEDLGLEDPGLYPLLSALEAELGNLFTYVPAFGAWAGVAMLALTLRRRAPSGVLGWYLLAGTLSALALYPRIDTIHAMFAGPPLLVVGAWALAVAHRTLAGQANRIVQTLVFLTLLVIPLAAAAPHVYWRYVTIVHADPRSPTPPAYVALGLARAPVQMPEHLARSIRGVVEYVQAGTPPGDPFFVYPVDPLFYFLADRPNPTRFNHFIAGALTQSDLQAVIADLERRKPRYVLWDHGGVTYFKADLTNRELSDYIWGCYTQVANFTPHLILERRCP
jgi:hypothetical protein